MANSNDFRPGGGAYVIGGDGAVTEVDPPTAREASDQPVADQPPAAAEASVVPAEGGTARAK